MVGPRLNQALVCVGSFGIGPLVVAILTAVGGQ